MVNSVVSDVSFCTKNFIVGQYLLLKNCFQSCSHVSKTREEFYSVRCQVADVKDLQVEFCENRSSPS